jgi:hypothetical protein
MKNKAIATRELGIAELRNKSRQIQELIKN